MIRESHYGDVISEIRNKASDMNTSTSSLNTHIATVRPSTPVHMVPSHNGWWGPEDYETAGTNLMCIEVDR